MPIPQADTTRISSASGRRRLSERAADALAAYWRAYTTWHNREVTRAMLRGLDDRTLKDIGLHRSQIRSLEFDRSNRQVRTPDGQCRALRWS